MDRRRQVQLCELETLKDVAELCDRHQLKYWLAYGTLLGAVRHQGFIPWDDDVDIYMKVKDLRKFVSIAQKELGDKYFIQCPKTERLSRWIFCKVRRNGTLFLQKEEVMNAGFHQGIFIDIFPLVSAPDSTVLQDLQMKLFFAIQNARFLHPHYSDRRTIKELIKRLLEVALRIKEVLLYQLAIGLGVVFKSSNYLAPGMEYIPWFPEELRKKERLLIDKQMIKDTAVYLYEGQYFTSIKDYKRYLSQFFGEDFMTPKQYGEHTDNYENCILPGEKFPH